MHAPVPPVNQTHSDVRFVAPRESEYRSAKVWLLPLPLEGETETALTPAVAISYDICAEAWAASVVTPALRAQTLTVKDPAADGVHV
jgi:hypothetical protein